MVNKIQKNSNRSQIYKIECLKRVFIKIQKISLYIQSVYKHVQVDFYFFYIPIPTKNMFHPPIPFSLLLL